MKKLFTTMAVVAAFTATAASAADLKMVTKAPPPPPASPWDIAFGASIGSDYIFRGVTQSNHRPSVSAYFEPRYNINSNWQLYAGVSGESISLPNRAAAEVDIYGGVRPTFGKLALDFGAWYYYYPGGQCYNTPAFGSDCGIGALPVNGNVIKRDLSFWEVYAKGTYAVTDAFTLGANFYYTPSFLNSGADGEYVSGTAKYVFPTMANGVGVYVSGEYGYQFLGTSDSFYSIANTPTSPGINYKDYATWNAGIGFTYKVFTLDLRYSDTNLSKADCNAFTSDYTASQTGSFSAINPAGFGSKWCGATFMAKGSFDLTFANLK
jgi:uncharacterized protein (TIGR02001 family)